MGGVGEIGSNRVISNTNNESDIRDIFFLKSFPVALAFSFIACRRFDNFARSL